MKFIDDIEEMAIIDDITPAQFLWLYVGVWVLLLLAGWFLVGGFYVFMTGFMIIHGVILIYHYRNPPIRKSHSAMLMPIFGLIYASIFSSDVFFQPELIKDKSQAHTITGIVPDTYHKVSTSGKGARTWYYLVIDGVRLHCDDDRYDSCDDIYAYKGETATVLYYDGLAYDIEVVGKKIYEFDAQADKFVSTQNKRKWQLIWAWLLFGVPSVLFFIINHRVIRDLEVMSKEQEEQITAATNTAQMQVKLKAQQIRSRIGVGGWAWRILFGLLAILSLFVVFLMLVINHFIGAGVFVVIVILLGYVVGMPLKNAKAEVAEYYEMVGDDKDDLSEYLSVGFYNYMSVFSWLMMYILCPCILIAMMLALIYMSQGAWFVCFLCLLPMVMMVGVVLFLIKRAINNRDFAFE